MNLISPIDRPLSPFQNALYDVAVARSKGSKEVDPPCGICFKKIIEEAERELISFEKDSLRGTWDNEEKTFIHKESNNRIMHKHSPQSHDFEDRLDREENIPIIMKNKVNEILSILNKGGVRDDDDEVSFVIRDKESKRGTKDKLEVLTKSQYRENLEKERGVPKLKKASSALTNKVKTTSSLELINERKKTPKQFSSISIKQGISKDIDIHSKKENSVVKDKSKYSWLNEIPGRSSSIAIPNWEINKSHMAYNREQLSPQRESQMVSKMIGLEENIRELEFTIKQKDEIISRLEKSIKNLEEKLKE
ncbi:unnamed protein product [Gordionus sp. m RMFG-2023]